MSSADKNTDSPSRNTQQGPGEEAHHEGAFRPRSADTLAPAQTTLQKLWRRLSVWMPTLANPHERRCLVRYESRDARSSLNWTVVLPRQCWKCAAKEELDPQRFDVSLKVYHQPVMIVSIAVAFVVMVLIVSSCMGFWLMFLVCAVLSAVVAGLLLKLKSWQEEVRLHIWTCQQHADELVQPDMIVEDESLNIFLPTAELAKAARDDLKERRKQGGRPHERPEAARAKPSAPAGPNRPVQEGPSRTPYRPSAPPEELPPIKLEGDDEEILLPESEPKSAPNSGGSASPPPSSSPKREEPRNTPDKESAPRGEQKPEDDRPWFDS